MASLAFEGSGYEVPGRPDWHKIEFLYLRYATINDRKTTSKRNRFTGIREKGVEVVLTNQTEFVPQAIDMPLEEVIELSRKRQKLDNPTAKTRKSIFDRLEGRVTPPESSLTPDTDLDGLQTTITQNIDESHQITVPRTPEDPEGIFDERISIPITSTENQLDDSPMEETQKTRGRAPQQKKSQIKIYDKKSPTKEQELIHESSSESSDIDVGVDDEWEQS